MYYDTNFQTTSNDDPWGGIDWGDISGGSSSSGSGTSSQQSGLPSWFTSGATAATNNPYSINNLWNAALQYGGQAWNNAITGGQVNPATQALIERQRVAMPEQNRQAMDAYFQRSINPLMNSLSSRGVLNSSITGDAMTKAIRDQAAKYQDQVTQANVWAGNELLKNMATQQGMNMDTWKNIMNFLPQLLAAIRESSGTSEWANESESQGAFPLG